MAGRRQDLETRIIAKDDASKVIDKVADELDTLEKRDTTIDLKAEDHATAEVETLSQLLTGLSDEDKTIVLRAKSDDAERNIDRILRSLRDVESMDQQEIDVRVEMLGDARAELDRIQDELRQLDGSDAKVTVEAEGLDDILDKLGDLPGKFGQMGGALSSALGPIAKGGGVATGVVGIAAGLLAAADHAADLAISAEVTSKLTGDTVENVSKVQQIWQSSGADLNDLNDILVQVTGALKDQPELAARLGVAVSDSGLKMADFVGLLDSVDAGLISVTDQSKLFGEEGIRQVAGLTARYDDLSTVIADMEPPVTAEDAANAFEMKKSIAELTIAFQQLAIQIGQFAVPAVEEFFHKFEPLAKLLGLFNSGGAGEGTAKVMGEIGESMPVEEAEKMMAAGVKNYDEWRRLQPVLEGIDAAVGSAADNTERTYEATSRQASIARTRDKEIALETRKYLEAFRTRKRLEAEAAQATAEAQEELVENFAAMAEGIRGYNDAVKSTDWGAADLEGAVTGMHAFTDAHLGLARIAQQSADAEQALADSVKENGKSFDFGTEAGLKNLDAIEGVAEAVDTKLAAAYASADGNQRKFVRSAQTIADETLGRLSEELGLSTEQTAQLAEALGLMPEDIETRYELSGTEEAQLKLDLLSGSIEGLPENKETRVTQKIIAGDYQGALDIIQRYYDENPATLPVKPVIVAGGYSYLTGGGAGTMAAPTTAMTRGGAPTAVPMAGPTLPTLMLPVSAGPSRAQQPIVQNLYFTQAVMGGSYDVMRAVEDAGRRAARLLPLDT